MIDLAKSYILKLMKTISNPFWLDVLKALYTLMKTNKCPNIETVLQTPVFYNEKILIGRKPVFYQTWYNKGVTFINDFVNKYGEFYSEAEFKTIFNVNTNFIQYNGCINAIKSYLNTTILD